jgi:leader peptidase (prepilin peptidase)/N-methyltransferase
VNEILTLYPELFLVLVGLLGLVIGSFLNVVVHRLPIMMETQWRRECRQFLELEAAESLKPVPPFNLAIPGSHCPECSRPLTLLENIPLVSYVALGGRCAGCKARISFRYPLVEMLSAVLAVMVAWQFGPTLPMLAALLLTWSLLALSMIDLDCQLLPDLITLPMLWLGLLASVLTVFVDSDASILGACLGYGSLWLVYWLFKWLTGKEGMGFGDFKLLAMLGAWLGWASLPMIILLASLVGAVSGLGLILFLKRDHRVPIPFGPYLAAAGWLALMWGNELNAYYLAVSGLR